MVAIINSMTKKERRNPALLNGSRRKRIAAGSGMTPADVNKLMKQSQQMEKMMGKLGRGGMKGMMRGMKGMMGGMGGGGVERKRVVRGTSGSVRVDLGGRRMINKINTPVGRKARR